MSRNVRQNFPRTPVKKAIKRRGSDTSSSLNLSDDDGYSGVEEISESDEDDEDHVFAAEEEHLTKGARKGHPVPARPNDDVSEDADEEDDDDADAEEEDEECDEEEDDEEADMFGDNGSVSWEGLSPESTETLPAADENPWTPLSGSTNVERHVRFAGVPDSDSDSTTSDPDDIGDFFPDIFVEQSALDPAFRREIERDDDSSNSGSFWDFQSSQDRWAESEDDAANLGIQDDMTPTATPLPSEAPTVNNSPNGNPTQQWVLNGLEQELEEELEGYETDGDTTDEDIPEPVVRKKQPKRSAPTVPSSDSDTERPVRVRRGQPRVGRYSLDDSEKKPIAVLNPLTRKMMIFTTPQKQRHFDLAPESFNFDLIGHPGVTQSSPIPSNPASLMMSAMVSSNTFGDFMNSQPFGPAEAFFPLIPSAFTYTGMDLEESPFEEEVDEEEYSLEIDDFITFHHDTDDEELPMGDEAEVGWDDDAENGDNADNMATPTRPKTSASGASDTSNVHPLQSHFENNSNAVAAFRRNQINQQLLLSEQATKDSLAFSGPYHYGTLRGIKSGSMDTVTTPITPVRRQKRSNSFVRSAPPASSYALQNHLNSSPLYDASQKRKASTGLEAPQFKRLRSIPEATPW